MQNLLPKFDNPDLIRHTEDKFTSTEATKHLTGEWFDF